MKHQAKVNPKLKQYIEENVFPQYQKNDGGHQADHAERVISRSFQLAQTLSEDLDDDIIFAAAAYHDIAHHIDKDKHDKISADIFIADTEMKKYFSPAKMKTVQQAIADHRASADRAPRSIYGRILSSADRTISVDEPLRRTHQYNQAHFPELTAEESLDRAYRHIKQKFGKNGYAKMYVEDEAWHKFLLDIQRLIKDKEYFTQRFREVNGLTD
jgi:uncharacterized protein